MSSNQQPSPVHPPLARGDLLAPYRDKDSRYEVKERIGQGGFGEVSQCFDHFTQRLVARKSLKLEQRDNLSQLRALINEARLVGYLEHPGIVPLYDIYIDEQDNFAYTMKHIDGEPLSEWMRQHALRRQPFPTSWSLRIFTKICETLSYAHDRGVLHLDLKPANVMLGTHGEVFVLDWGSARLYQPERYENHLRQLQDTDDIEPLLTLDDRLVGTPPYLSPEQVRGERHRLSPASDVFCAGVLFYQMLSSTSPFASKSTKQFVHELFTKEPIPLHERRADIPHRLSQIGARMLAKRQEDRYQDFREVLQDLQEFTTQGSDFEMRTYDAGEIIFREGELGDHAFQIIDGLVEVSTHVDGKPQILATLERGHMVGELAVFTRRPRTATVRALQPTTVQLLTADNINNELEKLHPWVGNLIYQLSTKFINLSQQMLHTASNPHDVTEK